MPNKSAKKPVKKEQLKKEQPKKTIKKVAEAKKPEIPQTEYTPAVPFFHEVDDEPSPPKTTWWQRIFKWL